MNGPKGQEGQNKDGMSFEKAMEQAFCEIFGNLKVIEKDTKKTREKLELRRRGSAPAATLRETTKLFKQPKEFGRTMSIPTGVRNLSVMEQPMNKNSSEEKSSKRKLAWGVYREGNMAEKEND